MTTETKPRTLEEIHNRWCLLGGCMEMAEPSCVVARVIRETVALGAASRASPEAPSVEAGFLLDAVAQALDGKEVSDFARSFTIVADAADLASRCAAAECMRDDRIACVNMLEREIESLRRASPEEGRGLTFSEVRAALRSPPAPSEETRASMPPRGTVIEGAIFAVGEIYGFPVGRRTVTVELDRDPGPIRLRERVTVAWGAPPPEDSGAREGACSCGGITQAPGEWAWEGGVLHTFSVCLLHSGKVTMVPPCRASRRAPASSKEGAK